MDFLCRMTSASGLAVNTAVFRFKKIIYSERRKKQALPAKMAIFG